MSSNAQPMRLWEMPSLVLTAKQNMCVLRLVWRKVVPRFSELFTLEGKDIKRCVHR